MLPDGSLFSIQEFQDLLDKRGSSSEFTLGQHLHQKQLSAKGQNRQTVSHVVNMVSHETADLIDHFHPFDPDDLENTENDKWHKLSRCCRIMADMHLVMTSNRDEESSKNKLHSPLGLSACFTSGYVRLGNLSGLFYLYMLCHIRICSFNLSCLLYCFRQM